MTVLPTKGGEEKAPSIPATMLQTQTILITNVTYSFCLEGLYLYHDLVQTDKRLRGFMIQQLYYGTVFY